MIAVTEFRAYAVSRPSGWAAGWYDGRLDPDGVRLLRDGREVLFLPAGGTPATGRGAELSVDTAAGPLTVRVEPPPPADPRAVVLGLVKVLAGTSVRKQTAVPWWLGGFVLATALVGLFGSTFGGTPGRLVMTAGLLAQAVALGRPGVAARDRAAVAAVVTVATGFGAATAIALAAAGGR